MRRVRLGRTGLMATVVGLGGGPIYRLPEAEAVAVVSKCLDLGMNLIDTANNYGDSEQKIGKAIAGRRDQVIIATKSASRQPDELRQHIDLSLQRLCTDYVDLYMLHWLNRPDTYDQALAPGGLVDVLREARDQGKIRHIGVSAHTPDFARKEIECGAFEALLYPLNFLEPDDKEGLVPLAARHNVGYIAMKPLAGGAITCADLALKYLMQFPNVVSVPGIARISEAEEWVALAESEPKPAAADWAEMQRVRDLLGTRFCRRCFYCMPCPNGVMIPPTMYVSSWLPHGIRTAEVAADASAASLFGQLEEKCTECGECETKCPYELPVREMMHEGLALYIKAKAEVAQ